MNHPHRVKRERTHRVKRERTAEQRAAEKVVRERFGRKPGLRELRHSGEIGADTYAKAWQQPAAGPLDDPLRRLVAALRAERERLGLSLADVTERSGIDRAAIHKLEIGLNKNPTIATLVRYADALGMWLTWSVETVPASK